ncbi:MAG: hypothetical protein RSB59_01170 [Clostridia bacterium]
MNKTNKKIVATISVVVVLATILCLTLVGCSGSNKPTLDNQQNGGIEVAPFSTDSVKLVVSNANALATAENGYTKSVTLTATIYPAEVPDKSVDWNVEWADTANTTAVADYVTATPVSDGALTATVTCKKPFSGDIVVTVITRSGKNTATCLVTYVGAPETVTITGNGIGTSSLAGVGSYYALPTGQAYTFSLAGSNGFGDVRTALNFTYSVSAVGNILTQDRKYSGTTDSNSWLDGTEGIVAIKDISAVTKFIPSAYEVSVSGNQLTINSNATLTGYYSNSVRSGQNATYFDSFKSFENDSWYYIVTVTETTSFVAQTLKFRPVASVSSIQLNNNVIGF